MGRIKAFGKTPKRQASEGSSILPNSSADVARNPNNTLHPPLPKTPLQILLSTPLSPPTSNEAPTINMPSTMAILVSEESASGWTILYRGQVSSTGVDARLLEESMPFWLLEYLLINRAPPIPAIKISFVLLPWKPSNPDEEILPELLNTAQSKLTASRFLRVRKLTHHVQDKLEKIVASSRSTSATNTPRSSFDARVISSSTSRTHSRQNSDHQTRTKPEDRYEIICNDAILPLDMTLAAVRQFIWRSAGELVMYYRRRAVT